MEKCTADTFLNKAIKIYEKFGNIAARIDYNKEIFIYYINKEFDINQAISLWPSIRIRLEISQNEFYLSLKKIDEILRAENIQVESEKYCIFQLFSTEDQFLIIDVYIKNQT